jgi:hypothetical protein
MVEGSLFPVSGVVAGRALASEVIGGFIFIMAAGTISGVCGMAE